MKVEDAIRQRRSIRRYSGKKIKDSDIMDILRSGLWAPSGLNNQPWKFLVVKEKNRLEKIAEFTRYGKVVKDAAAIICVFLDNGSIYNREKDLMSIGACIQNILLKSYELKIGSCWLGEIINRKDEIHEFLKTGPDNELMAVVALGYPDGKIPKGRRKGINSFMLE